jgi:hypothetical protein
MDVSRATRALTNDAQWPMKVLIGGVFALLSPLLLPALLVLGYQVETLRLAAAGDDRLPTWDDLGGHLVRGGLALVIQVVYALPVIILACCMGAVGAATGNREAEGMGGALGACLVCLTIPFALAAAYLAPAAIARYVAANDIAAAFNVGSVIDFIRANAAPYTMAFVFNIVLGLVAGIVGAVLCGLPLPWLGFVAGVLGYHLYGQVAQADRGRLGAALAPTSF